jgi:hypothetical protein
VRGTENILKTLNTDNQLDPWKLPMNSKLLSLVVIFTQSIQLSKIVCGNMRCSYALLKRAGDKRPAAKADHKLKDQCPPPLSGRKLNLELVCFDVLQRDGGAERDRTVDPLLAKQVLSQLSYSPHAHHCSNVRESGGPG